MTCQHCGRTITGTLRPWKSHRICREKARGKAQYAKRLERRIEASYRARKHAA